jgi:hypothetical protein
MAGAVGAYAQGSIVWSDYVGGSTGSTAFTITIWSPNPASPTMQQIGNTATDAPGGGTVYGGVPLGGSTTGTGSTAYGNGNAWTIALYASTSASTAVVLTTADEVASSTFENMGGTGKANILESPSLGGGPGYAGAWSLNFGSSAATLLPGTTAGSAGGSQLQLAAWYSGGGVTSYATAFSEGLPAGASEVGILNGLGGGSPPATAPDLGGLGITSFSLATTVPEPSTIALGVIGASAFLMRLRRKV